MPVYVHGKVYWVSKVPDVDSFGNPIHDEFIDGRLVSSGQWGLFTPATYAVVGSGLGTGLGQRYKRQSDGKWLKIEG